MNQRDQHNALTVAVALAITDVTYTPAVEPDPQVDAVSAVGEIIDRFGHASLEFVATVASLTEGSATPLLEHGDEADLSDATTVGASDLLGTIADATLSAGGVVKIGYVGIKRYVRWTNVPAAASTYKIAVVALLERGY